MLHNQHQLFIPEAHKFNIVFHCSPFPGCRLMELSKKLSSLDEQISCDLAHLTRVSFHNLIPFVTLVADWIFNDIQIRKELPRLD